MGDDNQDYSYDDGYDDLDSTHKAMGFSSREIQPSRGSKIKAGGLMANVRKLAKPGHLMKPRAIRVVKTPRMRKMRRV